MSNEIDGFYAAYVTGKEGMGFAMFAARKGVLVGADPMGAKFDGRYKRAATGALEGSLEVTLPSNTTTVQGVKVGVDGASFSIPVTLPTDFAQREFVRVDTPLGAINVKIVRLRGLDV